MSLYARIVWFGFSAYLAYPLELFSAIVRPLLEIGVVLLFWSVVSKGNPQLEVISLLSYFLIAGGMAELLLVNDNKLGNLLGKDIKLGEISNQLIKPIPVIRFAVALIIGRRSVQMVMGLLFVATGLLLQPPSGLVSVVLFIVYIPIALSITLSCNVIIGSASFFVTESTGVRLVYRHINGIFSGSMVPLYLFPPAWRLLAISLPFASMVYGPTQALRTPSMTAEVWLGLVIGITWALVLPVIAQLVWRKGLRGYDAVGI